MKDMQEALKIIENLIEDKFYVVYKGVFRPYMIIDTSEGNAKERWSYFLKRYKRVSNNIESEMNDTNIKITFKHLTEDGEELFLDLLDNFIEILKKKYHTVTPKVGNFVMIVKTTHRCNLNCRHCYDAENRALIKEDMKFEYIDKCLSLLSQYTEKITWIWHGGEPTLLGVNWYYEVYEKVFSKYPMLEIKSSLMSNGYYINHEWIKMFKDLNINAGMSYDSSSQRVHRLESDEEEYSLYEQYLMPNNEVNIKKVNLLNTIKYMKDAGLEAGVITVISYDNCDKQIELYEDYKNMGIEFSFNLIYPVGNAVKNKELELDLDKYMEHFIKYFTHWFYDTEGVKERSALEALRLVVGGGGETCINSDCRKNFVGLNPLGIVSPCDRKLPKEYDCGSIMSYNRIEDIFNSTPYRRYSEEAEIRFRTKCSSCGLFENCKGGCNSNAINIKGSGVHQEDFYCKLTRYRFMFVYEFLRNVDLVEDKINPHVREFLVENNFYSVKEIKSYIDIDRISEQYNFKLEYTPEDIFNCTEYQVFRGVNKVSNKCCNDNVHIDFVKSYETKDIIRNKESRIRNLKVLLRSVAENVRWVK